MMSEPGPVQILARLVLQTGLYDKDVEIRAAVDRVLNVPVYDAAPALLKALEAMLTTDFAVHSRHSAVPLHSSPAHWRPGCECDAAEQQARAAIRQAKGAV